MPFDRTGLAGFGLGASGDDAKKSSLMATCAFFAVPHLNALNGLRTGFNATTGPGVGYFTQMRFNGVRGVLAKYRDLTRSAIVMHPMQASTLD